MVGLKDLWLDGKKNFGGKLKSDYGRIESYSGGEKMIWTNQIKIRLW